MNAFTLSDLNRRPGELADIARNRPITLNKHGRPYVVMMSVETYAMLEGRGEGEPVPPMPTAPKRQLLSGLQSDAHDEHDDDKRD